MAKNFHRTPFDESTKQKLSIFGDYISKWLPVWISKLEAGVPITIADFFAGPGLDSNGTKGTPLIALDEVRKQSNLIKANGSLIRLEMNEHAKGKAQNLEAVLEAESIPDDLCKYRVRNLDFHDAFQMILPDLQNGPNLLLLDQQGMKFISEEVFTKIRSLKQTDFLFFIASSHVRRFRDHPHFQKHLPIPAGRVGSREYNSTHREITEFYRELAGKESDWFLSNFSLKKGSNLYGLIFGSRHPRGAEKFLSACWRVDPARGEANFDIDDDQLDPAAPHLWPDMDRPKKLSIFEEVLRIQVLAGEIRTDGDVYLFALKEGCLPRHGRKVILDLIREGRIAVYEGLQPRVSWVGCTNPRQLKVTANGAE